MNKIEPVAGENPFPEKGSIVNFESNNDLMNEFAGINPFPVIGPLSGIPQDNSALNEAIENDIVMDLQSCTVRAEKAESECETLLSGIKDLYRGYVETITAARQVMIEFGYPCDPVELLENKNLALIAARELIKKIEG